MKTILDHDRCVLFCGDSAELDLPENSIDSIVCDPPSGIAFMGNSWDKDKGGRDAWIAWLAKTLTPAFRALKPGGHALVWAIPRTSHWTATALEDLGFEIRDRVAHLFLSGFPKSLNVSKAIDAHLGAKRGQTGNGKSGQTAGMQLLGGSGFQGGVYPEFNEAATKEAAAWEGWGTALKPAVEDWWLVRKPLEGTVAANVLKHGTGAINLDASRIQSQTKPSPVFGDAKGTKGQGIYGESEKYDFTPSNLGRFPSHLIVGEGVEINDVPDPAKFFYCPKPSKAETELGLDHLPIKSGGDIVGREEDSAGIKNPRAGAGRGGGRANFHPTKKATALMTYLIRLITPPGGTVLDPFAGSGTTGVAALNAGFSFVGVEQGGENEEYIPILLGRINHALK
jgi:DNA methylase